MENCVIIKQKFNDEEVTYMSDNMKIKNHYVFNTTKTLKMIHKNLKDGWTADRTLMIELINTSVAFLADVLKKPEEPKKADDVSSKQADTPLTKAEEDSK